jgi:hypothetical protein
MQNVALKAKASLGPSGSVTLGFAPQSGVSIVVSNSANLTQAQVTTDDPNAANPLWSNITFTNNAAAFAGPIAGIRLTANGSGCDYSVLGVQSLP